MKGSQSSLWREGVCNRQPTQGGGIPEQPAEISWIRHCLAPRGSEENKTLFSPPRSLAPLCLSCQRATWWNQRVSLANISGLFLQDYMATSRSILEQIPHIIPTNIRKSALSPWPACVFASEREGGVVNSCTLHGLSHCTIPQVGLRFGLRSLTLLNTNLVLVYYSP